MFTGIVEEVGTVAAMTDAAPGAQLRVECRVVTEDARIGDSISVSGCCVTITALEADGFTAELMGETLRRTALGRIEPGSPINLERALRASDRLGGHLVQGHVDGVGTVVAVEPHDEWTTVTVGLDPELTRYVAEKGSITIDGVSLTVTAVTEATFEVGLIPHTLAVTTLGRLQPGTLVNLEVDVLAKYLERLMTAR